METRGFKRIKIYGWRQFNSIDIELHPRLTIITGANGAGKSTLLSFFIKHFGYQRNYLSTPKPKSRNTSFTSGLFNAIKKGIGLTVPQHLNEESKIGEIEYLNGQTSELLVPRTSSIKYEVSLRNVQSINGLHIDSHRPPNIYRFVQTMPTTPPMLANLGAELNSEFQQYYSSGQVSQGSLHHIKMTLIQMSIFGYGNQTMEPMPELIKLFQGFEEKLRTLLPNSLGFNKLIVRAPEVLLSTDSGDFIIDAASGGVIKLIEIAWQLYFYSQGHESFVVTFDEPENHLHPSMQKSFLPNVLKAFPNVQIIVVTHSPFIITALKESFVYVLRYEETPFNPIQSDGDESIRGLMGSRVFAERLDTINKAGTASEVLRDVLGITTTIPDWAEDRVIEIIQNYRDTALDEEVLTQIHTQLEKEGLASSYPSVLTQLTRAK